MSIAQYRSQRSAFIAAAQLGWALAPVLAGAAGFDKVNTTVDSVRTTLIAISLSVVTIAIMWAGFKMIFQSARLADVANILLGATMIGGAAAFAAVMVN